MKLKNIKTIISREYLTRVKKKSFLLITFLGPIFFAAVCILPSVIMFMTEDKGKQIAVVDQSGIAIGKFADNDAFDFTDYSAQRGDEAPRSSEIWPQPMGHHIFLWRMESATEGGYVEIKNNRIPINKKHRSLGAFLLYSFVFSF